MIGMSERDSSSQEKSRKKRKHTEHRLAELREQRERLDARWEEKEKESKEMEEEVRVNSQKMLEQSERNTIAVERLAEELAEERRQRAHQHTDLIHMMGDLVRTLQCRS